ncbi:hypothetical protein J7L48_10905 [bacterium]|nr:hypothetical protein [bacterium]
MKKLLILAGILTLFMPIFAGTSSTLLITKVAPVGDIEFSEDWIELENISALNQVINETYLLTLSNGDTYPLLTTGAGTAPITMAPGDLAVVHFTYGTNDTAINDNNPGYWDIYLDNTIALSAQYDMLALSDGSTYIDTLWYKTNDTTYFNTVAESSIVSLNQWDTTTRPVYYAVGNGLARMSKKDNNNAFDWQNVALKDMKPGTDITKNIAIEDVKLYQNYPNPFTSAAGSTTIKFFLPAKAKVTLKIYTISGDIVKTLITDLDYTAGFHTITWDGSNDGTNLVQSGNLLIGLKAGTSHKVIKMTYIQ